jgi:hypothetical protein
MAVKISVRRPFIQIQKYFNKNGNCSRESDDDRKFRAAYEDFVSQSIFGSDILPVGLIMTVEIAWKSHPTDCNRFIKRKHAMKMSAVSAPTAVHLE